MYCSTCGARLVEGPDPALVSELVVGDTLTATKGEDGDPVFTLKVETDTGTQTRLFSFRPSPAGEPSWQGTSAASWNVQTHLWPYSWR